MIQLLNLSLCLLLFTNYGSLTEQYSETQSPCQSGSSCTPRWKCNNEASNKYGQGVLQFRATESNPCPYLQICCRNESIKETPRIKDPSPKCGFRNMDTENIKIGNEGDGKLANFAEFPWIVAIFVNEKEEMKFIGGGSILTPNMVLTAAHIVCSHQTGNLRVRAGEWDTQTEEESSPYQERDVFENICHEDFNNANLHNDIAVVNLRSDFNLSHHIMPICLPRIFEYPNIERCFVAGWGKEKFTQSSPRNILRKVNLPILDSTTCQQQLRETRLGKYFVLDKTFVCAGGEKDLDSCTGDGGSPLFCPLVDHPGQYYQLGIVAWGLHCNYADVPSAYTNVPYLISWVHNVLRALSANPNYYTPSFKIDYYNREQELFIAGDKIENGTETVNQN